MKQIIIINDATQHAALNVKRGRKTVNVPLFEKSNVLDHSECVVGDLVSVRQGGQIVRFEARSHGFEMLSVLEIG